MVREAALSRRQWALLLVLCGALFLDALDVSMSHRLSAFHAGLWICAAIALAGLLVCAWPLRPGAIPNRLAEETP